MLCPLREKIYLMNKRRDGALIIRRICIRNRSGDLAKSPWRIEECKQNKWTKDACYADKDEVSSNPRRHLQCQDFYRSTRPKGSGAKGSGEQATKK